MREYLVGALDAIARCLHIDAGLLEEVDEHLERFKSEGDFLIMRRSHLPAD